MVHPESSVAPTKISKAHWALIIERIRQGACVPFLGAAVNVSSDDYRGLPLGEEVALGLIREIVDLGGVEPAELVKIVVHERLMQDERDKDLARVTLKNLARVALHGEQAWENDYQFFLG